MLNYSSQHSGHGETASVSLVTEQQPTQSGGEISTTTHDMTTVISEAKLGEVCDATATNVIRYDFSMMKYGMKSFISALLI